jgi:hypothetical protein
MPHTTSGNKRIKRPDFRPNGKQRRKDNQATAAATPVEKLIRTRIHSSQRKERPVTGVFKKELADPNTVRTRSLQKLLRQIASLAEKHQAGVILNDAQLQKLGRFDAVVAELEELLGSDEEDDEIEESEEETYEEEVPVEVKAKKAKLEHVDRQDKSKKSRRTELVEVKAKKQKLTHQDKQQAKSKKSKQTDLSPREDKNSQRRRIK